MTLKEIGEMIRVRRLSRGMTQDQLADAIGVSPSAVGMYEAGRRKPKDHIVEALADVFNVPKYAILYREDEIIAMDVEVQHDNLTISERRLLSAYRAADERAREDALNTLLNHPAHKEKELRA